MYVKGETSSEHTGRRHDAGVAIAKGEERTCYDCYELKVLAHRRPLFGEHLSSCQWHTTLAHNNNRRYTSKTL